MRGGGNNMIHYIEIHSVIYNYLGNQIHSIIKKMLDREPAKVLPQIDVP
jgi:hypothetical protein